MGCNDEQYDEAYRLRDAERKRTVQEVNSRSARSCGCDEGANHMCAECTVRARAYEQRYLATRQVLLPNGRVLTDPHTVSLETVTTTVRATGIGGAPTRATILPTEPVARKQFPVASGVLDYFPDALAAIANVSWRGNEQHNPGQPLHWARGKSGDEADTMIRHFLQRGSLDSDGTRHTAKMAWRALALLQKEIEQESK